MEAPLLPPRAKEQVRDQTPEGWSPLSAAVANVAAGSAKASKKNRERSDVADFERHLDNKTRIQPQQYASWCDAQRRLQSSPHLQEQRRLREPGGFRRGFLIERAEAQGVQAASTWRTRLIDDLALRPMTPWGVVDTSESEGGDGGHVDVGDGHGPGPGAHLGTAGMAITIFKANCGVGILFMPRAFRNGGYALSGIIVPVVATLSVSCSLRFLRCHGIAPGEYGALMTKAVGPLGGRAVQISIVLLQSGVCCLYVIFSAQVIRRIFFPSAPFVWMVYGSIVLLAPLAAIRHVSHLWLANMAGTVLIMMGLLAVVIALCTHVSQTGVDFETLAPVRFDGFFVVLGTACYMMEGIGVLIPMFESCAEKQRFPCLYAVVMSFCCSLVMCVGFLGYAAYGDQIQTFVLHNLGGGLVVNVFIPMAFAIAMMCTFPLQLLPAVRLLEDLVFRPCSRSGKVERRWKTGFRTLYVLFLLCVSVGASTSLDHFVSCLGGLCGMPLSFVFPALCHLYLIPDRTTFDKAIDICLVIAGVMFTIIVTMVNIQAWIQAMRT